MSASASSKTSADPRASARVPDESPSARDDGGSRSFRLGGKRIAYAPDDGRRKSIQFNVAGSEAELLRRSESVKRESRASTPQGREKERKPTKRMSSPPPPR